MGENTAQRTLVAVFVVGTRPEAIKMLPVIRAFRESSRFGAFVVSTGQHAELVADVLALGGIEPDVTFERAAPGRGLNQLFADVLGGMNRVFEGFGPTRETNYGAPPEGFPVACFVHGDTSSAAAAALAAFHTRVPVVHVEAGLRTDDTLSPFPEELNRQLISRIAALHLAPTFRNEQNLILEGIDEGRIFVSGNTAIDTLFFAASLDVPFGVAGLDDLEDDATTRVVVVTAHRRENWGDPLERIAGAVATLAAAYPDVRFVVPLHPNPAVQEVLRRHLAPHANASLVESMGYAGFSRLLGRAAFVISDSGGIQEEAPALGKPVLVLRETTERQEGVEAGTVELVGSDPELIVSSASRLLDDPREYARRSARSNPYGDGHAAERIRALSEHIVFGGRAPQQFGAGIDRMGVLRAAGYLEDPADELGEVYHDGVADGLGGVAGA
ncbi:non-hydrolyzing UDP-N-acetylglucosamine 2-epimerase [Agromyces sp. NPDC056965]|uniref:non-hydrolyzing UDP-N-acetylglucosamine 2-epimerase n=1 Tax=Agromyces sp. NPDC056965 TaxID=3345983 RepID=UPI00362E7C34